MVGEDNGASLLILKYLKVAWSHRHGIMLCDPKGGSHWLTC